MPLLYNCIWLQNKWANSCIFRRNIVTLHYNLEQLTKLLGFFAEQMLIDHQKRVVYGMCMF